MSTYSDFFKGSGGGIKPGTSLDPSALDTFPLPSVLGTAEIGRAALYMPGVGVTASKNNSIVLSGVNVAGGGIQKASRLIKISSTVYIHVLFQQELTKTTDGWTQPNIVVRRLLLDPVTGLFSVTQSFTAVSNGNVYVSSATGFETHIASFTVSYSSTLDTIAVYQSMYNGGATSINNYLSIFKNITTGTITNPSNTGIDTTYAYNGTIMFHPNYQNVLVVASGNRIRTYTVSGTGQITQVSSITSAFSYGPGHYSTGGALEYYTGDLFVVNDISTLKIISVNSAGTLTTIASGAASTTLSQAGKFFVNSTYNRVYCFSGTTCIYCNLTATTISAQATYVVTGMINGITFGIDNVASNIFLGVNVSSGNVDVLTSDGTGTFSYKGSYKQLYKNMPAHKNYSYPINNSFIKMYYEDGHLYSLIESFLVRIPVGSLNERYIGKYIDSTNVQAKYVYTDAAINSVYDNKTVFATNKAMFTYSAPPLLESASYDVAGSGTNLWSTVSLITQPDSYKINWNQQSNGWNPLNLSTSSALNTLRFYISGSLYFNFKVTEYQYDF